MQLPAFRVGDASMPSLLLLWILHFVDQVDGWYFARCVHNKLKLTYQVTYKALLAGTALNQVTFKGLVAAIFAEKLIPSEMTQFRLHLVAGPHKRLANPSKGVQYISDTAVPLMDAKLFFSSINDVQINGETLLNWPTRL